MYIKSVKDLDVYKLTYEQAMVVLLTTGHRQQVMKLPILNEKEPTL